MGTGIKIAFPIFGNGNGNENCLPDFWEREWDAGIPGNGREREREWLLKIQSKFEFCPKTERGQIQSTILFKVIYSTLQISKNYVIGLKKIIFRNNVSILVMFFMKKLTAQIANMQNNPRITFLGLKIQELFGHFGKIPWRTLWMPTLGPIKC